MRDLSFSNTFWNERFGFALFFFFQFLACITLYLYKKSVKPSWKLSWKYIGYVFFEMAFVMLYSNRLLGYIYLIIILVGAYLLFEKKI
jgi:hypothetical protein